MATRRNGKGGTVEQHADSLVHSVGEALRQETVGQRLKRLRLERGYSQRDLSSPGVSYAYISRIEAEARTPSVKALRKLAEKLEVTVEYLETGADETVDDVLLSELHSRTGSAVRLSSVPGKVFLRWDQDGQRHAVVAPNLTEALLGAVALERERAEIIVEQIRLAQRARALR